MNVKVLSKSDDETEVEIEGEDHTLLNVLKNALLDIDGVEAATYDMNPEQSGSKTDPVLYVKTSDEDPLEAVDEAAASVSEEAEEFKEAFADAA